MLTKTEDIKKVSTSTSTKISITMRKKRKKSAEESTESKDSTRNISVRSDCSELQNDRPTLTGSERFSPFGSQNTSLMQTNQPNVSIVKGFKPLIRTKKYKTPEEMLPVIAEYFSSCDDRNKKYTIEGLALALGFSSTEALRTYGTGEGYEAFHELVKQAKLKIQEQRVEDLQSGDINAIAGIFLLSNCHKQDYKRDPDGSESGKDTIKSFLFDYKKPMTNEANNDDAKANA